MKLPWNAFNVTNFEALLNSGALGYEVRGDALPSKSIPRYVEMFQGTNLSYAALGAEMPMVGMALAAGTRPLEDYLDWQVLGSAYANAYRLLFARAMVDVLGDKNSFQTVEENVGQQTITTEAVSLEPLFVHIVASFLSAISLATIILLALSSKRKWNIRTDPSTMASVMTLVADNQPLLSDIADSDCCTMEDVQECLGMRRFKLLNDSTSTGYVVVPYLPPDPLPANGRPSLVEISNNNDSDNEPRTSTISKERADIVSSIAKPVRPVEFSLWASVTLFLIFLALAISLGLFFSKAYKYGMSLLLPAVPSITAMTED